MRSLRRADDIRGQSSEQEEIPWSMGQHNPNQGEEQGLDTRGPGDAGKGISDGRNCVSRGTYLSLAKDMDL